MFDIAKYYNNCNRIINCNEHYDPGLLSLSLRSTQPGLQLKDEFGKWIIPPHRNDVAILWTGDMANKINPILKKGIHRVIRPNGLDKPRISIWYEICIEKQEHTDLLKNGKINPYKLEGKTGIPMTKTI